MHVYDFLEDILFPLRCIFCGKDGRMVCGVCVHTISFTSSTCVFCGTLSANGDTCISCRKKFRLAGAMSVFQYSDPRTQNIINHLKFTHQFAVLTSIKQEIEDRFIPFAEYAKPDVLVPVPSSRISFYSRGYHPAVLIADICTNATKLPLCDALIPNKKTSQHFMNKAERMRHLDTFFKPRHLAKTFKHAMVIDDILTTGGTAEAAARTLLKIGFERVTAFTLARQDKKN